MNSDFTTANTINRQASVLMKHGIALLNENTPASLKEAISHFDQAIALRQNLPLDANPFFQYGLAAGWMNRGDALTRLSAAENLGEALRSYDVALQVLQSLGPDTNPLFRRRLVIAWSNRGLTLQMQNNETALFEAQRSFEKAIAALQEGNAAEIADRHYLLATASINYANVLLRDKTIESLTRAQMMAKQAMILADQNSAQDLMMLEVNLKARNVLCQVIAKLLTDTDQGILPIKELIHEATDTVDDGMILARRWERRDIEQFRHLVQDLFTFGARVYQTFQPHFLDEFLLENKKLLNYQQIS
jgi:tetratricopeptide (TPR) repeat protein